MAVLMRPLSFLMMMLGAFALKRVGLFKDEDATVVRKIVYNLTLPAAAMHVFDGLERDPSLFVLVLVGLVCCFAPIFIVFAMTRRRSLPDRVFLMINSAGYNIGSFAMPLIQYAFGAPGAAIACMFDTGNAVIQTSGAHAVTTTLLGIHEPGEREGIGALLRKFYTSVPFDMYMIMMLLTALDVKLPRVVLQLTEPIAQSNSFFSMVMVGLMLQPTANPAYLKNAATVIGIRLVIGCAFAAVFYFLTPFPLLVRQVLAVIAFAPIGSLSPATTQRCGGDGALAGFTNSLSVLIALLIMSVLMVVMVS